MHWFFTGLLIVVSAGTVGFGGLLLRWLFTAEPGPGGAEPAVPAVTGPSS